MGNEVGGQESESVGGAMGLKGCETDCHGLYGLCLFVIDKLTDFIARFPSHFSLSLSLSFSLLHIDLVQPCV